MYVYCINRKLAKVFLDVLILEQFKSVCENDLVCSICKDVMTDVSLCSICGGVVNVLAPKCPQGGCSWMSSAWDQLCIIKERGFMEQKVFLEGPCMLPELNVLCEEYRKLLEVMRKSC